MSRIKSGRNALSRLAAGFVLLGLAALPIAGCSRFAASTTSDEASASALDGSSMNVQSTAHAGPSATANPAAAQDAPPSTDQAAAVPAPVVPAVTSATTATLAAAAPVSPSPVAPAKLAQTSPPATAILASTGAPALSIANTHPPILKGLDGHGMRDTAQTLNPVMIRALKKFNVASAAFPDFCRDWGRKLSVREHDNLRNIKWQMRDGVETGKYVGYGAIDSCTCKEATNGVAVGILTYKEFDYTLTGKNIEEAKLATPHATTVVPTREIFAYDKGKWFW
jgi:hypothetical protein